MAMQVASAPDCARAGSAVEVGLVYLERKADHPPTLSNFETIPEDQGVQGARLAVGDNNTSGKFLGRHYFLEEHVAANTNDFLSAARAALAGGRRVAIVNAPTSELLAAADLPEAADDLILNAASADVEIRNEDCRRNVLHTMPSRDMLTDALMQFLVKRQWTEVLLVTGHYPTDQALGAAFRTSATKFGAEIVDDLPWLVDADIRRSSGQEVPVLTQQGDYDVVVVADEEDQFGAFFEYNTWQPRPVAGTAGLLTSAWSPVLEQWAAIQLQERFAALAGRTMRPVDYAAWLAGRSIGEAVARTGSTDPAKLRSYMLSPDFVLDGFKGARLSFRSWNGQLRQPIPLTSDRALVAMAPLDGFLHPDSELDTLGLDQPESKCPSME